MTDALPDDELRALAEAATPWTAEGEPVYGDFGWYVRGCPGGECDDSDEGRAHAAFIAAANPTTVLALLDRLAHAEARTAEAVEAGVREALDEVERRINSRRIEHWQEHLREHPLADGSSCPRDYGMHDAYLHATRIVAQVRAARGATEGRAAPADGEAGGGEAG